MKSKRRKKSVDSPSEYGQAAFNLCTGRCVRRRNQSPASQGNMNKAAVAAVVEPNITNHPKRCVGGKFDKRKTPNPEHTINSDVPIGCQRCEVAFAHGAHGSPSLPARRANIVR